MARREKDITGIKFGKLTAIKRIENGTNVIQWLFLCDCGNEKVIFKNHVKSGASKSCGCTNPSYSNGYRGNHGMSGTRFYDIWSKMLHRCYNHNDTMYCRYGGRGISVCDRWKIFEHFQDDMYTSYREHSDTNGEKDTFIDRIDNNKNYNLSNCRWATRLIQNNNRSSNKPIEYNGRKDTLTNFCRELGLSRYTVRDRLKRGWSIQDALSKPIPRC